MGFEPMLATATAAALTARPTATAPARSLFSRIHSPLFSAISGAGIEPVSLHLPPAIYFLAGVNQGFG